jgi:glycosyltransferase involved in cell wall biosynthesis
VGVVVKDQERFQPAPPPDGAASPSPDGDPISVAFAVGAWPPDAAANGVLRYVANIADGMRLDGHRVAVMSVKVEGDHRSPDLYRLGDARHRVVDRVVDRVVARVSPARAGARAWCRSIASAANLAAAERGLQLLEMEEAMGWPTWVRRLTPVPLVVRLHGPWFLNGPLQGAREDADFRRRVRWEGEAIRGAEAVTASSRDVLEQTRAYYGLPLESAVVIPDPCPLVSPERLWRPAECDPSLVLFVGRFDRHKGGDVMIDAFVELLRERPEARLCFAGPDYGLADREGRSVDIVSYLTERAGRAWSEGRIEWLGRQPASALDVLRRRAAVTVVASRYDNFPATVREAMVYGSPLVATRTGGIPEMVEDGVHGLLCPPGDAPALASAVRRLLDDPALAARLGARAAEHCHRTYHPTTVARAMVDYYRFILDRAGPRPPRGR